MKAELDRIEVHKSHCPVKEEPIYLADFRRFGGKLTCPPTCLGRIGRGCRYEPEVIASAVRTWPREKGQTGT